jgi:hypothetical protein
MMKKIILLFLAGLVFFNGCSLFPSSTVDLTIATNVPADIYVNGAPISSNNSFAKTAVLRNKPVQIIASAKGYETTSHSISTRLSGTGIADIIFGCFGFLWTFIGLALPGSRTLDETNVN